MAGHIGDCESCCVGIAMSIKMQCHCVGLRGKSDVKRQGKKELW